MKLNPKTIYHKNKRNMKHFLKRKYKILNKFIKEKPNDRLVMIMMKINFKKI